jgi:uncharacterized protein (DUF2252 family)
MKTKRFAPSEGQSILGERRNLKMARSAHAYVRGNTQKFYEWLESAAGKLIPEGTPVWICGDCHVGNIGPVANVKGALRWQSEILTKSLSGIRRMTLSRQEKTEIEGLFEAKEVHQLVRSLHGRDDHAKIRVVDAAYRMKGCSSLGRLRHAVLLRVGKGGYQDGGLCLIDIKEATKPLAPRAEHGARPRNNAKRVVEGAQKLSDKS